MTPIRLRLRHPELVFYVDVTLTEHEGRWLATALLADEPDVGTGARTRGRRYGSHWRHLASPMPRSWQRVRARVARMVQTSRTNSAYRLT